MKKIIILTKENNEIIVEDDNNDNLLEFTKKISTIMSSGNVTILETSDENIIIRPSNIGAIRVIESKDNPIEDNRDDDIDMITDVD